MIRLYLSFKQILLLLAPLLILFYLYNNANQGANLIKYIDSFISSVELGEKDYKDLAKESFEKQHYLYFDTIESNFNVMDKSLFLKEKDITSWMIAYFYKILDHSSKNQLETQENQNKMNNINKLNSLQKNIDMRNEKISSNLDSKRTKNLSSDFVKIEKHEIEYIKAIIASRNLKAKKIFIDAIDLTQYNLQMVLLSKKNPLVIINGNVYEKRQRVDNSNVIVEKILKDKVLLKNKKESKWLYLIK